jgi:hypothetical protein
MNNEVTAKKLEFSEEQVADAIKDIKKWLSVIIADCGRGKIEIYINADEQIIDVKPTLNLRHYNKATPVKK